MSNTAATNHRRIDTTIAAVAILGAILAIVEGLGIPKGGRVFRVLTVGFPAVIAILSYLHYYRGERPVVVVFLGLWGIIASTVAIFGTFFIVIEDPALVPDAPLRRSRLVSSIAFFVLPVVSLSGLYALAGHYKSRALALVAPVTQLIAFVIAAHVVPWVA